MVQRELGIYISLPWPGPGGHDDTSSFIEIILWPTIFCYAFGVVVPKP